MKVNFPFLFSQRRQLVDVPPRFHAGDPGAKITMNINPEAAADEVSMREHRSPVGHRLDFAETLARMNKEHDDRLRAIKWQDRAMYLAAAISFLVLATALYFALKYR